MSTTWKTIFIRKAFLSQKFKIEVPNFSNLSLKFKLTDKLYDQYTLVNLIIKVTYKKKKRNPKICLIFINLSLHYRRKPSTLRAFAFTVGKKLKLKTNVWWQTNAGILKGTLILLNITNNQHSSFVVKIVFLNQQTNICLFKYELRGFYDFTLRNTVIGQYYIYRKQMKKILFSKNEAFLYSKNGSEPTKRKVIFRFIAFKLPKKDFWCLDTFSKFSFFFFLLTSIIYVYFVKLYEVSTE